MHREHSFQEHHRKTDGPAKPLRTAELAPLPLLAERDQFTSLVGRQLVACRRLGTRPAVLIVEIDVRSKENIEPAMVAALLQAVGSRLRGRLRGTDLVAQLGGWRFGVVLLGAARQDVPAVQARVQNALRGPYSVDEHLFQVEPHSGAAAYPDGHVSGDDLVAAAEAALNVH